MAPAISVVVCIYNVERYLRECLQSIADQSFTDFECILCDDDSSDASGLIASSFAEADSRFVYVHQRNRGPGPAGGRNGGIPHVSGGHMLFVDSDDVLLPDALEVLYRSAQQTGSELVIGGVDRFNSSGRWPSFLHQRVHEIERRATSIDEYPEMVWDSTAWNKLIATDLWMEHIKFFDEGRLYEDLYPMVRLMCLANSVDIVSDTVYLWRDRESKTSVTQQVASTRGLVDKVDQMLKLDAFLRENDERIAKQAQDHKLLTADLVWILDDLDRGSKDYHEAFWSEVPDLVEATDESIRAQLPPTLREQYEAIVARDRPGLSRARRRAGGVGFSPHVVRQVFSTDDARNVGAEGSLLTELFGRACRVRIDGDELVVNGYAALDRIRVGRGEGSLQVWFEQWETGQRVECDVDLRFSPRLHLTRQGPQLHRWAGFEVRVSAAQLVAPDVPVANVMVGARLVTTGGHVGSGRLRFPEHARWHYPQGAGSASVRAYPDHEGWLSFKVAAPAVVDRVEAEQDRLQVVFDDGGPHQVCLHDPVLKRRWWAEAGDLAGRVHLLDLSGLSSGEYELQMLRTSRVYEDGWIPIVARDRSTLTSSMDARVLRLHLGSATTFVEIADSAEELRPIEPTVRSRLDDRLTEFARTINSYTWI